MPSRDIPGPGKYDVVHPVDKKIFNTSGNSVFCSKVPNAKDAKIKNTSLPGPQAYDPRILKRGDKSTFESNIGSTDDSSTLTQNLNPFLSSTGRADMWKNEMSAPFTRATYSKNPGPGQYFHGKKKEEIKQRLLQEETVKVPFGSSDERPCNKMVKAANPGPGTYIDINNSKHSSIGKSMLQEDRQVAQQEGVKLGAFGSATERTSFWVQPKDGPSPGQYDINCDLADATTDLELVGKKQKARVATSNDQEHRKANSVFTSNVNRFDLIYHK